MELFKLFGSIFVDNEQANNNINDTDQKAEGLGNKFLKGVGTAAKWGAAIAGAAVVAVGGMINLAGKTAETADFIDKLSERTGVNREELQRWKYAAEQSGADVSKFEVGVKKLSAAMDGASKGSKASQEAFNTLGISMEEVQAKSPSEMLDTVLKKLADMPDSAERNALGNQLLGKSYSDMLPLLNAGSQGIEDLKNRADELGLVMSEDAVKANVKFGDTMADVKASFSAVFMHISNEFLPVLQMLLDYILKYMPQIQIVFQAVFGVIGNLAKGAIFVIKNIMDALDSFFNGSVESSNEFKTKFEDFKKWFGELFNTLKEIVETVLKAIKIFWEKYGEDIVKVVKIAFDSIKTIIDTVLKIIKGIVDVAMGILSGDWDKVWNGLKDIVQAVFKGIGDLLPKLLDGVITIIKGAGKFFLDAGEGLFNSLLEGLKNVWSNIVNWVEEKITWLGEKIKFWDDGAGKIAKSANNIERNTRGIDGSHYSGLSYVPFDGYIAELHKGERVITADENRKLSSNKDYSKDINAVLVAINNLSNEIKNQPYKQRELERKGAF